MLEAWSMQLTPGGVSHEEDTLVGDDRPSLLKASRANLVGTFRHSTSIQTSQIMLNACVEAGPHRRWHQTGVETLERCCEPYRELSTR